ncbi:MAG: tetratricopeptide repeat protein [Planctomycetes bacterium]|nr:tetratricopeptide repeat protein [Planctomycetota bacterium]
MQVAPESPTGAHSSPKRDALALLAILLATAAVYWRGLAGELVYDDRLLIARNPLIADLANLPRLFTSGYWDFLELKEAQYIGYWRPLTAIVQALIWPIAGIRPLPYHVACLAIHLGAVAAAYGIARRLSGNAWLAGATALLFALHPAHVESVAWISALNDPLFGCLALLSIERFLAWRARGSRGIPLLALLCFSLALLAKELAAALVPLLVLLDLLRPRGADEPEAHFVAPSGWPRRLGAGFEMLRVPPAPLRAYAPFGCAFALYMLARMLVFHSPWAGFERVTTDFMVGALRLVQLRVELFGGALEILTVPLELNVFRPFRPYLAPFDPALVRAALFAGVYTALLVASFLRASRLALAALLIVPAGLLPALIKVQSLGVFPLSDRFLYLPVFGFALGVALLLRHACSRRTATALLLVVGGLYAARSATRSGVWHDEETLFATSAAQSPRSVYVQWGLGRALLERLNETREPRYLSEAQAVFERAGKLLEEAKQEPTDLMVSSRDYLQVNLGLAWCAIYAEDLSAATVMLEDLAQRIEEIQTQEQKARAAGVRVREQFLDLDRVYTALGVAQYKDGAFDKAERSFQRALELQPSAPETHANFGRMYAAQERWAEAAREFEASARLRPGAPEDRLLLAQAWETLGKSAEAEALATELVPELPRRAEPLIVLATGALRRGDSGAALSFLERALLLEPRNGHAWYQKARAFLLRNEPQNALTAFRNAVELEPRSFEAHYDCAAFLLAQGLIAEARPYLIRAYELATHDYREPLRRNLAQLEFADPRELLLLCETDTKRDELAPALGWLERALALSPNDEQLLARKARLLRRLGRDEDALSTLRGCAERAPKDYELWSELGSYLHSLGRLQEARPALQHALELEPPASWPTEMRERSLQKLRETLDAPDSPTGK